MEFIKAFEEIDKDDSGEITRSELEEYMNSKKYKPVFVEKWLRIFDADNSGTITLEEFCNTLGLIPGKKQKEIIQRRNTLKQLELDEKERQRLADIASKSAGDEDNSENSYNNDNDDKDTKNKGMGKRKISLKNNDDGKEPGTSLRRLPLISDKDGNDDKDADHNNDGGDRNRNNDRKQKEMPKTRLPGNNYKDGKEVQDDNDDNDGRDGNKRSDRRETEMSKTRLPGKNYKVGIRGNDDSDNNKNNDRLEISKTELQCNTYNDVIYGDDDNDDTYGRDGNQSNARREKEMSKIRLSGNNYKDERGDNGNIGVNKINDGIEKEISKIKLPSNIYKDSRNANDCNYGNYGNDNGVSKDCDDGKDEGRPMKKQPLKNDKNKVTSSNIGCDKIDAKENERYDDNTKISVLNYRFVKTTELEKDDVEIIAADPDISDQLKHFVLKLSLDAVRMYHDELEMARNIKNILDHNFQRSWHVVAGRQAYGCLVTHDEGKFIHVKVRDWGILMWQVLKT